LSSLSNDLLALIRSPEHIPATGNTAAEKKDSTMRDDFLGADWSANHSRLSADIHKLVRAIGNSFDVLNRQQFAAPWRRSPRRINALR
jgi:hypothetical protein